MRIKVLNFWYRIERDDLGDDYGKVYFERGLIQIHEDLQPEQAFSTLLHELVHIGLYTYDRTQAGKFTHELAATVIEPALFSFFEDNDVNEVRGWFYGRHPSF